MKRVLLLACSVAAEMRPRQQRSLRARPVAPRPAAEVDEFEQRRRLACVNVDTTQDSYGDTSSSVWKSTAIEQASTAIHATIQHERAVKF